jgi:hypothetical protein
MKRSSREREREGTSTTNYRAKERERESKEGGEIYNNGEQFEEIF